MFCVEIAIEGDSNEEDDVNGVVSVVVIRDAVMVVVVVDENIGKA